MKNLSFVALVTFALVAGSAPARSTAQTPSSKVLDTGPRLFDTKDYRIRVVTVASGLSHPYSLAFLPDGNMLVTEMDLGRLRLIRNGVLTPEPIAGMPVVESHMGESGLMDVALHPDFARNSLIYLTYNKPGEKGGTMALARGKFNGTRVTDLTDLFVAEAWGRKNGHNSSRIVFAPDGMLYMFVADRNEPANAQNMNDHMGKVLRLRDDGTVPRDNPFVGRAGHRPEIFTFGHRNPHGIAIHPKTGEVWEQEHGDEVNIIKAGGNYGWPYLSVGGEGGGTPIAPPPAGIQLVNPIVALNPAIGSHGLMFYTGNKFPNWQGNLFMTGSRTQGVTRIELDGNKEGAREQLFTRIGQPARDVKQGPDGLIYFTTDGASAFVMRIEPAR